MTRSIAIEQQAGDIGLRGWLGRPELARGSRSQQFIFVNSRPVQNRIISGAVEHAYQQIVPAGKFPVYVLFITVPPRRVDINVHPRKLEIRFDDDHQIFGAVHRGVREALRTAQLIRSVQALATPLAGRPVGIGLEGAAVSGLSAAVETTAANMGRLPALRLLGQFQLTYLLAQGDEGLVVIDQHAAHERVLYERMLKGRARGLATGQVLIAPQPVRLGAGETAVLEAHRDALLQLGFDLEPFGDGTVLIRAIPQVAGSSSAEQLLHDLLAEAAEGERLSAAQTRLERLTITTACRTAIRAGDALTVEQMIHLLRDLAATDDPFTCFHGRPTMVTLRREQVERWFLRR